MLRVIYAESRYAECRGPYIWVCVYVRVSTKCVSVKWFLIQGHETLIFVPLIPTWNLDKSTLRFADKLSFNAQNVELG
jgi:hypothetical protein